MLNSKTAVITGGARGIGLIISKKLIELSFNIVICSRTKKEIDEAIISFDNLKKGKAYGFVADVSDFKQCKDLIDFAYKKLGSLYLLVNNAGIYGPIGRLEENSINDWKQTIDVNLMGAVNCTYLTCKLMKDGGKIINLCGAGVGGERPLDRFSAYYTSKAAIAAFTEVMAAEFKDKNIQVNCIAPGAVNTLLTEQLISAGVEKAGIEMYRKALKQKETGEGNIYDIEQMIEFLCSADSDHLTGCLLSAKWDPVEKLKNVDISPNLYKLRRINNRDFYEKSKKD